MNELGKITLNNGLIMIERETDGFGIETVVRVLLPSFLAVSFSRCSSQNTE